jgi:hypothetical protein
VEAWLDAHPGGGGGDRVEGAAFPVPELAARSAWLANVREVPDGDGVFRRVAPFRIFDGRVLPSLGFAGWLAVWRNRGRGASIEPQALQAGGSRIPLDGAGRMILKFRGRSGTHQILQRPPP